MALQILSGLQWLKYSETFYKGRWKTYHSCYKNCDSEVHEYASEKDIDRTEMEHGL